YLLCYPSTEPGALHTFPTRRSSDLAGLHTPIDTLLHEATRHTSEPTGGQLFPVGNDPPRVMGSRPMVFSPEPSALLRLAAICSADRKSTRLNSSHGSNSYAAFCL